VNRDWQALRGKRLLVVEDDYLIAADLARALERLGVEVVGPTGSIATAIAHVKAVALGAALLDISLGEELAYPIADELSARGVPFLFTTGYGAPVVPSGYANVPRLEKPVDLTALLRLLVRMMPPSSDESRPAPG
jgi:ActR/RegA family two-component response regulator